MTTKKSTKRPVRRVGEATRARVRDLQADLIRARRELENGMGAFEASTVGHDEKLSKRQRQAVADLAALAKDELQAALGLLRRAIREAEKLPGAMRSRGR